MKLEKYALKADSNLTVFEFISEGSNGPIRKLIHFQETNEPGLFNLAFGDKGSNDNEIDDLAISNNGDTVKILATVVSALYAFFDRKPNAFVYATCSTATRTRLYRMGITKYYDEIIEDFDLFRQVGNDFFKFQPRMNYDGFLVQRKMIKLQSS